MSRLLRVLLVIAALAISGAAEAQTTNCPDAPVPGCKGPKCGDSCGATVGDPMLVSSGLAWDRAEDVVLQTSLGPLRFYRTFSQTPSTWSYSAAFGLYKPFGSAAGSGMFWTHNFFSAVKEAVNNPVGNGAFFWPPPSASYMPIQACDSTGGPCWASRINGWRPEQDFLLRRSSSGYEYVDDDGERWDYQSNWVHSGSQYRYWLLTGINDREGRHVATVSYAMPATPDGGACTNDGTGTPPYISEVTTVDSQKLVFKYTKLQKYDDPTKWDCVLDKINIDYGGGSSVLAAQYTYQPVSGSVRAGLIASVAGSANHEHLKETYASSFGAEAGYFRLREGTPYSEHVLADAGITESFTRLMDKLFCGPSCFPTSTHLTCDSVNASTPDTIPGCCMKKWVVRTLTQSNAAVGDGTTGASYQTQYVQGSLPEAEGQLTMSIRDSCSGHNCSPGLIYYYYSPKKADCTLNTDAGWRHDLPHHSATKDKRDNWTLFPHVPINPDAGEAASHTRAFLQTSYSVGAINANQLMDGTHPDPVSLGSPLYSEAYSWGFGAKKVKRLQEVARKSVLGASDAGTIYRYANDGGSQIDGVFTYGRTETLAGSSEFKTVGVFLKPNAVCAGGGADPLGRVRTVEGPCFVSHAGATGCASPEPVTELTYASTTPASANAGKLSSVTRYPNGCSGGGALTTSFSSYTAEGEPQTVTGPDGQTTTYTYDAHRVTSMTRGGATWNFAYENGELTRVQYPEQNYLVICHRVGTESGSCDSNQPWSRLPLWVSKANDSLGANWSERLILEYWPDGTVKKTIAKTNDGTTVQTRHTRQFAADSEMRPTWSQVGDGTAGSFTLMRGFDGANNDNAVSLAYNTTAPAFCRGAMGVKSPLCTWLEHDRANRPAIFDVFPSGSEPGIRTCFDYDSQGNVSGVASGCSASVGNTTGCTINTPDGISSCGVRSAYKFDDFGNVIEAKIAGTDDGSGNLGAIRYVYNAAGRQTNQLTPLAEQSNFLYDGLGRLTAVQRQTPGGPANGFTLTYDSATLSGCPIAPTNQAGRLARVKNDVLGTDITYSYDAAGRLLHELRRTASEVSGGGCPSLKTSYAYTSNGNLSSLTYPHGRQVTYQYGADAGRGLNDRVTRIDVNLFDAGAQGVQTLISSATWEPFGGLRGYQLNFADAGVYATVEYMLGDNTSTNPSGCDAGAPTMTAGTYDGTGRLRSLRVTASSSSTPTWQTAVGDIYRRSYTWQGDQVSRIDTCYRSMATPIREDFTYDKATRLTSVSVPNFSSTGGFQNGSTFAYDARGNRQSWLVDNAGGLVNYTYGTGNLQDRLLADKPWSGSVEAHAYAYDQMGRFDTRKWGDYANVGTYFQTQTFAGHHATGPDSAVSSVITPDGMYDYYYDAFGRRVVKRYPTYDQDEFIWSATGRSLFEDIGLPALGSPSTRSIDDYVWLGGRPVAQLRGQLTSAGQRSTVPDRSGAMCERLSDGSKCDFYFIVTDHVGKPVLMLDSKRRIAGVGEHEPFGRVNTVEWWGGVIPSTSATTTNFVSVTQPTLSMNLQMRPYLQTLDLELNSCGLGGVKYDSLLRYDNALLRDFAVGTSKANVRMSWLPMTPFLSGSVHLGRMALSAATDTGNCPKNTYQASCTPTCSPATSYSGVQLRRYEYQRFETATRWGSDTSWKQTTTFASGWEQSSFNDSSWSSAVSEGAYGGSPWFSAAQIPAGTSPTWIWYYDSRPGSDTSTVYFRKSFTATGTQALVTITADNSFVAYLNGAQIASGTDWGQPRVAKVTLLPGSQNVLAISATNAGGPGGLLVEVNETTSPIWTALRFPGQYYDPETDLHENGHRFYDPETGRYTAPERIQRDPMWQLAYAYEGYALPAYAYALNNPVNFADINGDWPWRTVAYWTFRLMTLDPSRPIQPPPRDPQEIRDTLKKKTSKKKKDNQCGDTPPDKNDEVFKKYFRDGVGWQVPGEGIPDPMMVLPIPWVPPLMPIPGPMPTPVPVFP